MRALSGRPRSSSSTARWRNDVASRDGAAVVIRCIRTTSRHRPPALGTGLGPHSAALGAAPSAAVICRWSPLCRAAMSASKRSTSPSPTRPRRTRAPARTRCALASPAGSAATAELVDGALQAGVDLQQPLRLGVDDELTPVAGRPRRQRIAGDAFEVVDEWRARCDVARRQEGFAADEQQLRVHAPRRRWQELRLAPPGCPPRRARRGRGRGAPTRGNAARTAGRARRCVRRACRARVDSRGRLPDAGRSSRRGRTPRSRHPLRPSRPAARAGPRGPTSAGGGTRRRESGRGGSAIPARRRDTPRWAERARADAVGRGTV